MLLPKLGGSGSYRRGTSLNTLRVTLWIATAIHLDTLNRRLDPFFKRRDEAVVTLSAGSRSWHRNEKPQKSQRPLRYSDENYGFRCAQ